MACCRTFWCRAPATHAYDVKPHELLGVPSIDVAISGTIVLIKNIPTTANLLLILKHTQNNVGQAEGAESIRSPLVYPRYAYDVE